MESIADQIFKDFEVIIIDDHCTDGTEKIIEIYGQMPGTVVVKHERNCGLAESLNDGLVAAKGEYCAIQHGDDISFPQRIEKEVVYLDAHPNIALVGTWAQNIDEGDNVIKDGWWLRQVKRVPDDPKIIRDRLLEMNILVHTSVMFRKSMLSKVGFYDQNFVPAEDLELWTRVVEHYDIGIIREVLCQYRRHHKQISNLDNGQLMKTKAAEAVLRAKRRRGL
jgi:cellulose synthase/poly-beta-1,6-N-acetylglucosamine synthase-like glycosyltransferase